MVTNAVTNNTNQWVPVQYSTEKRFSMQEGIIYVYVEETTRECHKLQNNLHRTKWRRDTRKRFSGCTPTTYNIPYFVLDKDWMLCFYIRCKRSYQGFYYFRFPSKFIYGEVNAIIVIQLVGNVGLLDSFRKNERDLLPVVESSEDVT